MRNIRTLLSVLMLSAILPVSAGAVELLQVNLNGSVTVFTDVPVDAWFASFVGHAAQTGVVSGDVDAQGRLTGKYRPGDSVTVAEALKIALKSAAYSDTAMSRVGVMNTANGDWARQYIVFGQAEQFQIFGGADIGAATPDIYTRKATRAEVAALIADAFMIDAGTPVGNRYDDVTASTKYAFSVEALSRDGILTGDTDAQGNATGRFRPTASVNRAETVKMAMAARATYGLVGQTRDSSAPATPSSSSMSPGSGNDRTSGTANSSSQAADKPVLVTLTDSGFSPSTVTIKAGQRVMFENKSSGGMWVASDPHPVHTALPGFDAKTSLDAGASWSFMFNKPGSWTFHNHLNSSQKGTVVVEQP